MVIHHNIPQNQGDFKRNGLYCLLLFYSCFIGRYSYSSFLSNKKLGLRTTGLEGCDECGDIWEAEDAVAVEVGGEVA